MVGVGQAESGALIDSLLENELATEEQRLLELADALRRRGQKEDAKGVYLDILEINPNNETARMAFERMQGEVTVTGFVPAPVSEEAVDALEDVSDAVALFEPAPLPPVPRERIEIPRVASRVEHAPIPSIATSDISEEELAEAAGVSSQRRSYFVPVVSVLVLAGVVAVLGIVWDTRQNVAEISTQLRPAAATAAVTDAPKGLSVQLQAEQSIDYRAPVGGIVTSHAEPGAMLKPGDLVAEIMDAGDYARLTRARTRYWRLLRKARRNPSLKQRAWRAKREALRRLTNGRMTYVRAAQAGIARPLVEKTNPVAAGGVVVKLDDPTTLGATLPSSDGIDLDSSCRFGGDAAQKPCRLAFEDGRVRVLLDNQDASVALGQTVDVTID